MTITLEAAPLHITVGSALDALHHAVETVGYDYIDPHSADEPNVRQTAMTYDDGSKCLVAAALDYLGVPLPAVDDPRNELSVTTYLWDLADADVIVLDPAAEIVFGDAMMFQDFGHSWGDVVDRVVNERANDVLGREQ